MIPEFNNNGYLPTGLHPATMQEVIQRFGQGSEQREAQGQSLQWLLPLCSGAGIVRILINGSFVTNRLEPTDVACVLLQGPSYDAASPDAQSLREGLPFLELKTVAAEDYDFFASTMFATDRNRVGKGLIKVNL